MGNKTETTTENPLVELTKASNDAISTASLGVVDLVEKLAELSKIMSKLSDRLSSIYYTNFSPIHSK